ncbi:MAG: methyltransferase [Oscillospiraceae bacterium]|nr:methyltransferase [Oscillospiraceae bacterium]
MKYEIFMSDEHKYGTDSLLLGEFVNKSVLKNKVVVDLCSGCGIIPFLICAGENKPNRIYAVEIQFEAVQLIKKSILANGANELSETIKIIHGDLRDEKTFSPIRQSGREQVDLVIANPPYYTVGSGFERNSSSQKSARYDGTGCTLNDVVKSAALLLKFGGVLKMCMTASRLCECISIMQSYNIEPKEIELIGAGKSETGKVGKARLFLISGKKGGKSGVVTTWQKQK